jgi:hypothetical protein
VSDFYTTRVNVAKSVSCVSVGYANHWSRDMVHSKMEGGQSTGKGKGRETVAGAFSRLFVRARLPRVIANKLFVVQRCFRRTACYIAPGEKKRANPFCFLSSFDLTRHVPLEQVLRWPEKDCDDALPRCVAVQKLRLVCFNHIREVRVLESACHAVHAGDK